MILHVFVMSCVIMQLVGYPFDQNMGYSISLSSTSISCLPHLVSSPAFSEVCYSNVASCLVY